ncbi:quinol:cytochrome C oxidoreductase [Pseudozobellia thermophila]|uniref:Quinol:cytochrome c oxidoreductase quinone-binding subunit 2 n=1 Tax=Pseudozobellia thermophila TaxID=192903 RepID=A0A1M6KJ48_9FLAO|nr:quinol:cytochrome C oxidoreductase [Pseudozobellia thermophila]SHJ58851.1 quinol:cytochrome c oxidoreductase quinone-binding subunit 2 [Pseudozobellia thermophila]
MYTFSNRLKIGSFILMAVGFLGIAIGFISAPTTVEEAKAIVASHDDGHGGHGAEAGHGDAAAAHGGEHDASHDEHLLHQLMNKPWAALYVGAFFFFMIALGVLAFYAIQRAAQAGWSPLLFRVMEGITAYLVPGGIIVFVILVLSVLHMNHLFVWMDPDVVAHDELIQGKVGYLNPTFFLIRAALFLGGWIFYREYSRKLSLRQDESDDNTNFKLNFRWSAGFLVFYLVTESMMSWDWIMSVDPHWFSTLFGWYVFASMFVSGITVIAMVTIYLKSKGLLPDVNDSHIHDLAKFMFGISIFWTYLWFSQFMLIWYSNIPEEVTYYVTRIADYRLPFFGMVAMNFVFPLLLLMNSDYKRINWFVVLAGIVILAGHYLDIFNMIMPATVGDQWSIGISELGAILFFAGLFIFWVFRALASAPLQPKRNPFIEESRHFHY